jgi:ribonucleotide reductase alpha subunit
MAKPTRTKLNAYHFYGWKLGLKTGMYYLRQKALTDPINFASDSTIIPVAAGVGTEKESAPKRRKWNPETVSCNPDGVCMACNL